MNPYPGLRPFRTGEAAQYFGRESLVGRFATRVRVAPLTVFFARSGVGKSSFLTCRLIPELRKTSEVAYVNEWGVDEAWDVIERNRIAMTGAAVARRHAVVTASATWTPEDDEHPLPEKPVLILDQFEDVFKASFNRRNLWEPLGKIVNVADAPIHVVVSMREEWLGAWAESAEYLPDGFRSAIRLTSLTPAELARAIEEPSAIRGGVEVDPGFASRLIEDLSTPSDFDLSEKYVAAGLVQLVCRALWDEAIADQRNVIDWALYKRLGGVERIRREFVWRGLESSRRSTSFTAADRVFWTGIANHLTIAEDVKSLVTPSSIAESLKIDDLGFSAPVALGTLSSADRRFLRVPPSERRTGPSNALKAKIQSVLDKGVSAGFLKTPQLTRDGSRLYELVHDSLGPIFRQFGREFDQHLKLRFAKVAGGLFLALTFLMALSVIAATYLSLISDYAPQAIPGLSPTLMQRIEDNLPYVVILCVALFVAVVLGLIGWTAYRSLSPFVARPIMRLLAQRMAPTIDQRRRSIARVAAFYGALVCLIIVASVVGLLKAPQVQDSLLSALMRRQHATWTFTGPTARFGSDISGNGLNCVFQAVPAAGQVGGERVAQFAPETYCLAQNVTTKLLGFAAVVWIRPRTNTSGDVLTLADDAPPVNASTRGHGPLPGARDRRGLSAGYNISRRSAGGSAKKMEFQLSLARGVPVLTAYESKVTVLSARGPLPAGRWSSVAVARSFVDDELRLYVNGHLVKLVNTGAENSLRGRWNVAFGNASAAKVATNALRGLGFSGNLEAATLYTHGLDEGRLLTILACKHPVQCSFPEM